MISPAEQAALVGLAGAWLTAMAFPSEASGMDAMPGDNSDVPF